jgi:hypothetical protein
MAISASDLGAWLARQPAVFRDEVINTCLTSELRDLAQAPDPLGREAAKTLADFEQWLAEKERGAA